MKTLVETFECDWAAQRQRDGWRDREGGTPPQRDVATAIQVFTKEVDPLTTSLKKSVPHAAAKAGEDVIALAPDWNDSRIAT